MPSLTAADAVALDDDDAPAGRCEVERGRQASHAGADHRNIRFDVARERRMRSAIRRSCRSAREPERTRSAAELHGHLRGPCPRCTLSLSVRRKHCAMARQMTEWLSAVEARHLADLRFPEVARAIRALSSMYVERRSRLGRGGALDGAGKRAAFALFFAPLHLLTVRHIVQQLRPPPVAHDCRSRLRHGRRRLRLGARAAGGRRSPSANPRDRSTPVGRHGSAPHLRGARAARRRDAGAGRSRQTSGTTLRARGGLHDQRAGRRFPCGCLDALSRLGHARCARAHRRADRSRP